MKPFFIVFSFSVFFLLPCYSQTINVNKLDSLFDQLQSRGLATGSVSISINGKIVYQRAIGFTMILNNEKILPNANTKYRIGSVTKMFTAVMIFQLIDEKKLNLDNKLETYFPQLPGANHITIRDLLYHRSGLHDYTNDANFQEWMDKPKTMEEMLSIIRDMGSDFEPGEKTAYSNTNYLLLGYIIEKICKMNYAKALERRITKKIGLKNTYYAKPIDVRRNEASSYKYADSVWNPVKETDVSIHNGAGSIVSTPGDLIIFIEKLFSGKMMSPANIDSMKKVVEGYGMGLFPYDYNTKGYGHNGRIEEFYTAVRIYPEKKLALSYITNGILYPRTDILEGVLKICFNEDYTIPYSKPVVLQSSDFAKYTGIYSSNDLPFKVVCKQNNYKLIVEAAGKEMVAEPVSRNYFMNLHTGTFFDFQPHTGKLVIKETDNVYHLYKEKTDKD